MDLIRFGSSLRALRRRRRWTQQELALRSRSSRAAVSSIERGEADRFTLATLERLAASLEARLVVRVLWHGEELDRLLDSAHATLVEVTVGMLGAMGWECAVEVTFAIGTERGSIDVLGWHATTRSLVVIEVKSVVPDVQAMLGAFDRKARLGAAVARSRGWDAASISRVLILPDDRTSRRRVERFAATFERVLPARTREIRRWLRRPAGSISGINFLSNANQPRTRHRVRSAPGPGTQERSTRSRQIPRR